MLAASALDERNKALESVKRVLLEHRDEIFDANATDVEENRDRLSSSILHRLYFDQDKLDSVVAGIDDIVRLPDPIGRILEKRELDSNFVLERRSVPIGVIGMIFESRPDALVQIASLCLKSGNGIILKGGREATNSNRALVKAIREATRNTSFGENWILQIESHEDVDFILTLDDYIDLLIPRGSNAFVRHVMENTRIPVLGHADGLCSVYVDAFADLSLAVDVVTDSKVQYPAACNAAETLLVHEAVAGKFLPMVARSLIDNGVELLGDEKTRKIIDVAPATDRDFDTEFLSLKMAIKVVSSLDEAIAHINEHGSGHTDAIVTNNVGVRDRFFAHVDSADVFSNCSTRFADGYRFGLGAEVGISTSKIHARGPVGLAGLTSSKWLLYGNGETVREYSKGGGKSFHHKELI